MEGGKASLVKAGDSDEGCGVAGGLVCMLVTALHTSISVCRARCCALLLSPHALSPHTLPFLVAAFPLPPPLPSPPPAPPHPKTTPTRRSR
jgi:hypothetical protein